MTFILYFVILVLCFFLFSFLGYVFHWFFHQPFSGIFYRKHYAHHNTQYPANDMFSVKYRSSGKDNSIFLFGILFAPIVLTALFLTIFQVIPIVLGILIMIEVAVIGYLNGAIHDDMQLFVSFWSKFWFFGELV